MKRNEVSGDESARRGQRQGGGASRGNTDWGSGSMEDYGRFPSGNDPAALREVSGWNWGAFLGSWVWAFAHRMPLLGVATLLGWFFWGIFGLAAAIYLGVSGNELAWRSRSFESVAQFREVQRRWAMWSPVAFTVTVVLLVVSWIAWG